MADPKDDSVYFVDNLGSTVKLPKEQAGTASHLGYAPATPEQVNAFEAARKYGDTAGEVKAFGAGAARGATFGLSDQALTQTGIVNPETLKGLETANPVSSGVGEGAGILGSLLIPGEGELNAAKLVGKAGQGVERLAARGLEREGAGLAERALAKGASKAAGGALEGVAYAGGHEVSEDAIGDPHLKAQSILAHLGEGALFGGAIGGLLGVGGEVLPGAISSAREAAAGLGGKLKQAGLEQYVPWAAKANGVDEAFVRDLVENRGSAAAEYEPAQVAKGLAEGFSDTAKKGEDLSRHLNAELFPAESESLINDVRYAKKDAAKQAYGDTFQALDDGAQQMRARPELFSQAHAAKLEDLRDSLQRDLVDVSQKDIQAGKTLADDPVEVFNRMQSLRKSLDNLIPYTRDMGALPLEARNAMDVIKDIRAGVKRTLTDESVFGEAAARKASLDTAQSEYISAQKAFNKYFAVKTPRKGGGFNYVPSQEKFMTYLSKVGKDTGDVRSEVLDNYLKAHDALTSEAEASMKSVPTQSHDTGALSDLVEKQGQAVKDARQAVARDQAMKQFGGAPDALGLPDLGVAAVAHSHPVLAGAYTAMKAGKATLSFLKDVPRAAATLATIEKTAKTVADAIDVGAKAAVDGGGKVFKLGRGELAAGLSREFGGTSEMGQAAFARREDEINNLANNPDYLLQKLEDVGPLAKHAPKTAMATHMARVRGVQYLHSKLPKTPTMGPLGPKLQPSKEAIYKFNRSYTAVTRPLTLLKHVAAGTLTPLDAEGTRTVHPELHQQMVSALMTEMAKNPEAVSSRTRMMMHFLVGQDVDGSTTPNAIASAQAVYRMPSQRGKEDQTGPGALRPSQEGMDHLKVANRMMTPGQAAESRREEA